MDEVDAEVVAAEEAEETVTIDTHVGLKSMRRLFAILFNLLNSSH